MAGPVILFVADAGPTVGGGHVMRSLTLARALQARGARCAFLSSPEVEAVLAVFGPDVERRSQADDAHAIVFDNYALGEADHRRLAAGRPALVIDDLADRPLGADMVLDSGPARRAEHYRALVPSGATLLLGPSFAPVRPEFAARREGALARRSGPVRRILLSLGLTDVGGVTARALSALRPRLGTLTIDVVVGSAAPSLMELKALAQQDSRIRLQIDTPDMAELIVSADIGVGAAGSTSWERCTLALPSILLVLADNQAEAARALAERGAALAVDTRQGGFEAALGEGFETLLRDEAARTRMARASAEVCDGRGAERVADAFLALVQG